MLERSLALVLCAGISAAIAVAIPYRGALPAWLPRDRIEIVERVRIVYACPEGYVCFPAQKDESQHVNTGFIPGEGLRPIPVRTSSYRAADFPPAMQAQDNRKRKRR